MKDGNRETKRGKHREGGTLKRSKTGWTANKTNREREGGRGDGERLSNV